MIVSYQPDHYDEDGEQVMRVRGRATYGTKESDIGNITFGQYKVVLCDEDTDKNEAFTQVISWANDWMKSYKYGKFDLDF